MNKQLSETKITVWYSRGYGKGGKMYAYIRPKKATYQHSRRVSGFFKDELETAIDKCIEKWYSPLKYYEVIGAFVSPCIIGSNSKENALKEYWRICDKKDIGKPFEIIEL